MDFSETFFANYPRSAIEPLTPAVSRTPCGDRVLCNVTAFPSLDGFTVREYLGVVGTLLGGGSHTYDIAQLGAVTEELNRAYQGGVASAWAQEHLARGACPSP